jgi:chitin disaccharide deacetylase
VIIINADDWGRSQAETNAALDCYREGRITSVSAMVFMQDSERAADVAKESGVDVGLHLNLSQRYDGSVSRSSATNAQDRIVRFMTRSKYAVLFYQPCLRAQFRDVYRAQEEEFVRLYGKPPTHVDGHQHRHLCANMLVDEVIPRGMKVRRNFTYLPGEKGFLNRNYRRLLDKWLGRRYRLVDYFVSLGECLKAQRLRRIPEFAKAGNLELMTHPSNRGEQTWLLSDDFHETMRGLETVSHSKCV